MQDKAVFYKNILIQYMEDFLENKISKEEYYDLSESCYSIYGELLQTFYPCFNKVYMEVVPIACLYYIDEPGLEDSVKEKLFRKEISVIYDKLINL